MHEANGHTEGRIYADNYRYVSSSDIKLLKHIFQHETEALYYRHHYDLTEENCLQTLKINNNYINNFFALDNNLFPTPNCNSH